MRAMVLAFTVLFGFAAQAATPYQRSLTQKNNRYMVDGVFTGGKAGVGSSILGVRRTASTKLGMERVIIDLGDKNAKAVGKRMPYFQVSVDKKTNRVVLDLDQLGFSRVTERSLKALFKKSPYVANVQLALDPEDKTGTMVLHLKQPMRLEVFQLLNEKKPARVVLDLVPLKRKG